MCKKVNEYLVWATMRAPLQHAIDSSDNAHKKLLCFLVSSIDVEVFHGILTLQMRRHELDLLSMIKSVML